jgi:S1-C subfamily serine protease
MRGRPAPQDPPAPRRRRPGRSAFAAAGVVLALLAATGCELRISIGGSRPSRPTPGESRVARAVDPRLVDVISTLGFQDAGAAGTGIVLTPSGEILTNNHVIVGATSVKVIDVGSGRTYRARVVGYDERDDVAVLALRGASGLKALAIHGSPRMTVGERVIALGNAGGLDGTPAIAPGRITGLGVSIIARDAGAGLSEHLKGLIRTDAGIQAGDSGGPLLTSSGRLIGLDTAASATFQFEGTTTEAFAIPVSRALAIARQIESGRSSARVHVGPTGFLGVQLRERPVPGDQSHTETAVAGVIAGQPASRTGLRAGDVLVSVAGHLISTLNDVQAALEQHRPGDTISIVWVNPAGQRHSAALVLARGPAG